MKERVSFELNMRKIKNIWVISLTLNIEIQAPPTESAICGTEEFSEVRFGRIINQKKLWDLQYEI